VLRDQPVAHRQAEARAFVLGGEERREDALVVLGLDPGTAVLDVDRKVLAAVPGRRRGVEVGF
jgi:hypothetical protein